MKMMSFMDDLSGAIFDSDHRIWVVQLAHQDVAVPVANGKTDTLFLLNQLFSAGASTAWAK
ncbi:hypothetical protein [Planococcus faecalis]|uniref:Uncharacterized protein n=1 Tax=Planococcus faecalis TaxID=1598147 RepID=A0ABM6IPJ8_9BACL|nr:hypothetical protein [Planococcus faecalis]AQU78489.1 hypothetical protein AJGP001_03890 [Planococcus faecalis]OHX51501.1 hypothetical protein BB777_16875 [Planococcus faecalis]